MIINVVTNKDTLPFKSDTFDFHFCILNIFSLNEMEISSKPLFVFWIFCESSSTVYL